MLHAKSSPFSYLTPFPHAFVARTQIFHETHYFLFIMCYHIREAVHYRARGEE